MLFALTAVSALVVFLALAALGAMREVVLLRADVRGLSELVRYPPAPSYVGDRIPEPLVRALRHAPTQAATQLVAFVSPGCQPCEALVEDLSRAVRQGDVGADELALVVWARTEAEAERLAPRQIAHVIVDAKGMLARACEIRATPTLLVVSRKDWTAVDHNLEGDVKWAVTSLNIHASAPVLA